MEEEIGRKILFVAKRDDTYFVGVKGSLSSASSVYHESFVRSCVKPYIETALRTYRPYLMGLETLGDLPDSILNPIREDIRKVNRRTRNYFGIN